MSTYLKFFELERSPFDGREQTQVVLGTRALRDAFAHIQSGLEEGASRICVSGGPGLGKTSLARALPKLLGQGARVATIADPSAAWNQMRRSLARQWQLPGGELARPRLLEAARETRLVLVIDQAERATEDFLDHLDVLLCYRSERDEPVVQTILLARLTPAEDGESPALLWWLDRIQTLSLEFAPLSRDGVSAYIHKHLKRAGWGGERLFSEDAAFAIHSYSGGVPGRVSALCDQLLDDAANRGLTSIEADDVHAFADPSSATVLRREAEATDEPGRSEEEPQDGPGDEYGRGNGPDGSNGAEAAGSGLVEEGANAERHWEAGDPTPGFIDPLLEPPSIDELRALRGSFLARHARPVAAAVLAAAIGGIALFAISGEEAPARDEPEGKPYEVTRATPSRTPSAGSESPLDRLEFAQDRRSGPLLFEAEGFVARTGPATSARLPGLDTRARGGQSSDPAADSKRFETR